MKTILLKIFISFAVFSFFFSSLSAATLTWNGGGGDNNWSTGANWGGTAPSAGDALVFAGSTRTSPNNDYAAGTSFASITFSNGASSFTVGGNAIVLSGGASAITASNASNTMTISLNITFSTSAPTITSTSGGTLTISGTMDNGGYLISVVAGGTTTFSGVISGTGAMTKSGAGNFTLSGANTFSGGYTHTAGDTYVGHNTALGSGTAVMNGTGRFRLNDGITVSNALTITASTPGAGLGTVQANSCTSCTWSGAIAVNANTTNGGHFVGDNLHITGAVSFGGTATSLVSRANIVYFSGGGTYTRLDAQAGTVYLEATNGISSSAWFNMSGVGTTSFDMNGYNQTFIGLSSAAANSATVTCSSAKTLTLNNNTNYTFYGVISGAISLVENGGGVHTETLSGVNTYTGTTTVSSGILKLGAAGVIPDASALSVTGTFDMNTYSETVGSITGSGTIDNASGGGTPTLTCGGDNTSTTFSGVIKNTSGTLSLIKTGSGTLTLSGANTYTGTTTVLGGMLMLGGSGMISNSSDMVMNGATFSTGSGAGYTETVGTLTLSANSVIALGTGSHTLSFAASDGTSWTAGKLLEITGWQGGYDGTSGTSGQIFTGSSAELSASKLAQIYFTHPITGYPHTATQLASGEIVPTNTLPVELVSFQVEKKDQSNLLQWRTASEINSNYFEVLRSSDNINFEVIGKIKAAGSSAQIIDYSFTDEQPARGINYYQLVEYDLDGAKQESKVIAIAIESDMDVITQLYPNPTAGRTTLYFNSPEGGIYYLKVTDLSGKEYYNAMVGAMKGENKFDLNLGDYANATYVITVTNPSKQLSMTKVVKGN